MNPSDSVLFGLGALFVAGLILLAAAIITVGV